jgi:hypothetical protein
MPEALRKRPEPKTEPKPKPERKPKERKPKEPKAVKEPKPKAVKPAPAPKPEGERKSSKAFPIAIAAGVVLALVLGFVIGGSGGSSSDTPPAPKGGGGLTASAAGGGSEVKVPSGWSKMATAPAVPGLSLAGATGAAAGGKDGGDAVVHGTVKSAADNPTLLAGSFLQGLNEVPKPAAAVAIGSDGLQAYRYDGLKPNGFDREVTVYAAPTSAGVATVACLAKDSGAFATTCDQIANTLKLSSGKPLPLGPSKSYASATSKTLKRLGTADKRGLAKMKSAKTPKAQAAAARSLSAAYAKAAKAFKGRNVGPADGSLNTQMVKALQQTSGAYSQAAKAASSNNKSRFASARGTVGKGRQAVADAIASYQAAGYDVVK